MSTNPIPLRAGPADQWRERDAELLAPCYARYSDLVVERAEGAHLYTVDGRDVLDFGSGIGVVNLGHRHPAVVAAVHAQVDKLWHTSVTALNPAMVEAAEALVRISPEGLDTVFLCNSGAEAVEAALKLARKATGRSEIIAFRGAFHGRTYGAVTLTASKSKYHQGIGPLLPGVHHVEYPYCLRRCPPGPDGRCSIAAGAEIERLLETTVSPSDVAAIVVEPVLGEGGYVVPPAEFLPNLRRICDRHGILLVCDEVQSGIGRTGRNFAVDHWNVRPDILCVAKAFGNGLPIGGIVASAAVMRAWHPGDHGTTFGGNPIACAAAAAVVRVLEDERVPQRAAALGGKVMARARSWQSTVPQLAEVRGLGLMIGLEFLEADGTPASDLVANVRNLALRDDLLLLSSGTDDNVIRLAPPLTIPESELDLGLDILERSIREAAEASR
ncbi:MAG TPA: aminotransferase class III-fold pyridoxal phosphate-dependent enzyme [Candidatus Dormibacteraeota bacterium]|nr:aminotransferase class III-fold pyridoxal phosphate-dependent enzyme [Candidatus Dormibacteraeota bacterium]